MSDASGPLVSGRLSQTVGSSNHWMAIFNLEKADDRLIDQVYRERD